MSGSAAYTCGPDGAWIDGDLHCEGLICGAVAPTEHAMPCAAGRYSSGDGLIPTAQCAPHCADGYDLNKTAPMPTNYTCALRAGKGSWTGGALACSPRVCEAKAPVVNAKECEAGPTCATTCADGYTASGKDQTVRFHCGDDRNWNSDEDFECASDKSSKWWTIPLVAVSGALLIFFCGECVGKLLTRIQHKRYGTTVKLSSHQDGLLDNDGLPAYAGSSTNQAVKTKAEAPHRQSLRTHSKTRCSIQVQIFDRPSAEGVASIAARLCGQFGPRV